LRQYASDYDSLVSRLCLEPDDSDVRSQLLVRAEEIRAWTVSCDDMLRTALENWTLAEPSLAAVTQNAKEVLREIKENLPLTHVVAIPPVDNQVRDALIKSLHDGGISSDDGSHFFSYLADPCEQDLGEVVAQFCGSLHAFNEACEYRYYDWRGSRQSSLLSKESNCHQSWYSTLSTFFGSCPLLLESLFQLSSLMAITVIPEISGSIAYPP
jgi:hypothetical protein